MRFRHFHLSLSATVSLAAILASPAFAQAQPDATEAGAPSDEIIVTGERRSAAITRTALAISAIAPDTLQKSNVVQIADINGLVPGLTIARSQGYNRAVTIRGVGFETAENQSAEPGVAFHIDGVYIARPVSLAMDLVDIDHVEVLRGPQGTVFGKSATGGLVNVIRAKPKLGETSGYGELALGNYSLVQATGVVNVPVSDSVAIRLAGQKYSHDGFAKQTGLDDYDLDDADNLTLKGSVLWKPLDSVELVVTVQHFRADTHGAAQKNIYDPDPDPRRVSQDFPNANDIRFTLLNGDISWDMGGATLRSTTAYQWLDMSGTVDVDRSNYATLGRYLHAPLFDYYGRTFSQELNISSTGRGPVDWIAGAFFMDDRAGQNYAEYGGTDVNPTYVIVNAPPLPGNLGYAVQSKLHRKSYALYAQATYHLTDWLRATGGLRQSWDNATTNTLSYYGLYGPAIKLEPKGDKLTYKAQVEADIGPDLLSYATLSTGYKPGGANLNSTPLLNSQTFAPEKVTSYEIGLKGRALDRRLRFAAAAFYYDYKNLQYQQEDPVPYQGGVANVPRVHSWGAEIEADLQASDRFSVGGNLTWLDGKIASDYLALDPSLAQQATIAAAALGYGAFDPYTIAARATAVRNTRGNKSPKMPAWQGSIHAAYRLDIASFAVTPRVEYIYRGAFDYRIFNDGALDRVPSYGIVNLNVDIEPGDPRWRFSVRATNLFNKAGINSRYSDAFGLFTTSNQYIAPRQVVGSVRYSF